ncbi:hypothetical protein [Tepidibacter sp. Z1-5]|uniref:hypothetical protein n=1 Tax=Tepidibacter sp. Z1-5 TaxID=3134138 RepID=UPI0030BCFE7F
MKKLKTIPTIILIVYVILQFPSPGNFLYPAKLMVDEGISKGTNVILEIIESKVEEFSKKYINAITNNN